MDNFDGVFKSAQTEMQQIKNLQSHRMQSVDENSVAVCKCGLPYPAWQTRTCHEQMFINQMCDITTYAHLSWEKPCEMFPDGIDAAHCSVMQTLPVVMSCFECTKDQALAMTFTILFAKVKTLADSTEDFVKALLQIHYAQVKETE